MKILEQLGLTKSEIKVYLALLELGSAATGRIVAKSKASSSKIYEILDKLIDKGLVSYVVVSGVKHFEAAPPERILEYVHEKERVLAEQKKELQQILPELKLKQTISKYKSEATIYKGMKGLHTAFYSALDLLEKKEEMLVIGIPRRSPQVNRFFVSFNKERARRGITSRQIFNEIAKDQLQAQPENTPNTENRFTPEITPSAINIIKDRVIIFPETKEPLLIQIDSKEVADSFRVQFEKWWSQDVTVYKGYAAVTAKFRSIIDILHKGDEYFVLGGNYGEGGEKLYCWFTEYHAERMQRGIKVKILAKYKHYEQIKKTMITETGPAPKLSEVRRLPPSYTSPVQITLIKNDTVFINFFSKRDVTLFEIKSAELYKNFKENFDILWKQDVITLKGATAVHYLCEDVLETGEDLILIGATGNIVDHYLECYKDFTKRRVEKNIKMFILADPVLKKKKFASVLPLTKYTYLPKELSSPNVIWVYGNKVANILWGEEPILFILENKKIADHYRKYYELLLQLIKKK